MQSHSSQYGDAHRNSIESLAILLKQDNLNPYLGVLYQVHRHLDPRNLLHWGEWGQALSEVEASIALLEKNGDYAYARENAYVEGLGASPRHGFFRRRSDLRIHRRFGSHPHGGTTPAYPYCFSGSCPGKP
jgi:hypothetical protein